MKVTEVTVNRGVTANLGNYESARFDVAVRAQLENKDTADKVTKQLDKMCREQLRQLVLSVATDDVADQLGLKEE